MYCMHTMDLVSSHMLFKDLSQAQCNWTHAQMLGGMPFIAINQLNHCQHLIALTTLDRINA